MDYLFRERKISHKISLTRNCFLFAYVVKVHLNDKGEWYGNSPKIFIARPVRYLNRILFIDNSMNWHSRHTFHEIKTQVNSNIYFRFAMVNCVLAKWWPSKPKIYIRVNLCFNYGKRTPWVLIFLCLIKNISPRTFNFISNSMLKSFECNKQIHLVFFFCNWGDAID